MRMTYLAISNEKTVISTASLLIVDGVANIWSVATLPSERGQGAATAIMVATCLEARRQGPSPPSCGRPTIWPATRGSIAASASAW